MKHKPDMLDRCAAHARTAMRQAKMKGLEAEAVSGQFILQALMATFAIDHTRAAALTLHCTGYALEMLMRDDLEMASGHEREHMAKTQAEIRSDPDRPAWLMPLPDVEAAVAAKLGKLHFQSRSTKPI